MNNTTLEAHPSVNACLWCGKDKGTRAKYCSKECGGKGRYRANKATAPRCREQGCDRPTQARGMCGSHYSAWHRANNPDAHSYICHGCGVSYTTARKAQGDKTFCTADCLRAYIARDPEVNIKRAQTVTAAYAARPKSSWGKDCAWCGQSFTTEVYHAKYCADSCKKDAAKDRRLKALSPLRYAYEHGDNAGIIEALRDGSTITPNGCWEWKRIDKDGYARGVVGDGISRGLHRVSLEAKHEAPLGEQAAHHVCANTKCVNPDHLQPVTHRENTAEMLARNSYLKRIAELEAAIREINPNHEVLSRIEMN